MAAKKHKKTMISKHNFITQLKRFEYGHIQFTRILSPISFVIAGLTLLKVYEISFSVKQIATLAFGALIGMYTLGLIWDKTGLVEEEIEYINERNRFVRAMLKGGWMRKLSKATIRR